jgi:CheY-like chemotaxis protein
MQPKTIIAVDDRSAHLKALAQLLAEEGYEVLRVESASEALETLKQLRVDLLLVDVQLPQVAGLDLARRVRETPAWYRIPLVGVSGDAAKEEEARVRAAGFDDYLAKPFHKMKVLSIIGQQLARVA